MTLGKQVLVRSDQLAHVTTSMRSVMARFYKSYSWTLAPLGIALGVRIAVLLAAHIFMRILPGQRQNIQGIYGLVSFWRRWDAKWYITIAQNGYQYPNPTSLRSNVNFFPLYPITIWIGDHIISPFVGGASQRSFLITGMAIAWISFAAACVVMYRLVERKFDQRIALLSVVLLAAFPFSFYYGAAYTESLYLLLIVVAFYGIERQAWWLAATAAMLASATRPPGLIVGASVVLAYVLDWVFQRRPIRWNVVALALTPLGLVAYLVYCAVRFGDAFAYAKASLMGWHVGQIQLGTIGWFLHLLLNAGNTITGTDANAIIWSVYGVIFVAALVGLVFVYRILGPVYAFFTLTSIAAPVLTNPVPSSLARYISVIVPLFIVLALPLRTRPALREALIIGFSIFQIMFALLFVMTFPDY